MKRSVNFNGFQAKHRRITANDLIATFRALGMSDEEIISEMKKLQAAKTPPNNGMQPTPQPGPLPE